MADIKLSLINQARTAVGETALSALGTDPCSQAAAQSYDQIVAEALEQGGWKFARKTAALTHLTAKADKPLEEQWQIPSESLRLIDVLYQGNVLLGEDYDIEGTTVRTRWDADITATYLVRPLDELLPARFTRIIIEKLEALFLRVLERHDVARARDSDAVMSANRARQAEASQHSNRRTADGSIVDRRRGIIGRRW